MTKDEQIEFLVGELKSIRDDFAPWHGEDAVAMAEAAKEALHSWEKNAGQSAIEPDTNRRCKCGQLYDPTLHSLS